MATRKLDGTCVKIEADSSVWARREVKPGKPMPANFVVAKHDEVTGKTVGWEPADQSSFAGLIQEAIEAGRVMDGDPPGTYELIGPKVNKNPEGVPDHRLVRHGQAIIEDAPRTFGGLQAYFFDFPHEGIVWHHPDGRMAKLKVRDFPKP